MSGLARQGRPSSLRCLYVMRVLQSYLDGETNTGTSQRVSEHLEACRRCGLEASTYRAISEALADHRRPDDKAVDRLRAFGEALLQSSDDRR